MADLFVEILGKPHGFIVFQLLAACRFTIYLSLIAFVGIGAIACLITLLRISKIPSLQGFATTFIWVFQSDTFTHAVVLDWTRHAKTS